MRGPQFLSTEGRPLRGGAPTSIQVPYDLPMMRQWRTRAPRSTNQSLCSSHPHLARGGRHRCSSAAVLRLQVLAGHVFRASRHSSPPLLHAQGPRRLAPLLGSCPRSLWWRLLLCRVLRSCASAQPPRSGGTSIFMLPLGGQGNAPPPWGLYRVSAARLVSHGLYVRGPKDSSGFCRFALAGGLRWGSSALSACVQFLVSSWALQLLAAGRDFWGPGLSLP